MPKPEQKPKHNWGGAWAQDPQATPQNCFLGLGSGFGIDVFENNGNGNGNFDRYILAMFSENVPDRGVWDI